MEAMRTLLNIIWFIFSGLWLWLAYMLAGVHLLHPDRHHSLGHRLLPDGELRGVAVRAARSSSEPTSGLLALLGNIIWLVIAGWWIALTHIVTGIALCITIIGIPMAIANFKLIPIALMPLGKEIVPKP